MNRLKLILTVSVFLLIIPLAFAAHTAIVSIDDTEVWEIVNNDFKLTVENDITSSSSINNITVTLPLFTVYSVNSKEGWIITNTSNQINWYTTTSAISPDDLANFRFTLTADEVNENTISNWTIETIDLDLDVDINYLEITIKNDSITPDIDDISPANFDYVKNTTIDFTVYILENETGIKSDANLGYRDDVGVTLTGNVTASISLTCDSGNNQCTGNLDPNSGMNLPGNPFLDFRIINLEDNAGNVYDVFPNLTYHYYVDCQAPEIELQAPPDQIYISGNSYDFVFSMSDDSFKTDDDTNWLGDSPAINCTLLIAGDIYGFNSSTQNLVNTTITADLTNLSDGNHSWQVKCIDDAGWSGLSTMRYFLRDVSPPNVELNLPNDFSIIIDDIIFNWTATDLMDNELECNLTIDGVVNVSNITSPSGSPTTQLVNDFTEGIHSWNVTCWDDSSNIGISPTWEFTVDITDPNVTINLPADGSTIIDETVDFEFIPDDNLDDELFCELFIDNASYAGGYFDAGNVSHFFINMTSPGWWVEWYIVCNDGLNYYYTDNYTFFLDTFIAGPIFWSNPEPPISTELTEIAVDFKVEFIEEVIIDSATFNGTTVTLTTTDNKSWVYTATVPSGFDYTLYIEATDFAGHSDSWDHTYTITYNAPPTPPPVTPPSGGGGGGNLGPSSGYEILSNPITHGDCAYNWFCDDWGECIDGKQTRTCTNTGNCEGDKGKPIEERDCTVISPREDTTGQGVGFAAGLFNRLKENWWIIPIIGALLAVLAYFGFGKYGTKIKIKQKLKDKEPINV